MAISSFSTFYLTIKAINSFGPTMAALRADFVRTAASMTALAVPIAVGAGLVAATKAAASYEQQMRKVQALALDPSQQKLHQSLTDASTAMGRLSRDTLNLAATVPYGPTKLAEALYMITSAGYKGKDAIDVLRFAAKDAATGGLSDATSMARSLTSILTSYGGTAKQAGMYSDIFMTAVTRGKSQVSEMDSALSGILPIAAGAGISFQQIAAAMAAITQHGTTASSAATSLRRAITAITAPTQSQRKAAEALGVGDLLSGKAVAAMGLPTVIARLTDAAGGGAEGVGRMKALFGTQQSLQAAMTLSGKSAGTFNRILAEMNGLTGNGARSNAAFANTVAGLSQHMRVAGSAINAAAVSLGLQLLPTANRLTGVMQGALVGAFRALRGAVTAVQQAFGPMNTRMSQGAVLVRGLVAAGALFVGFKTVMLAVAIAQKTWTAAVIVAKTAQLAYDVVIGTSYLLMVNWRSGLIAATVSSGIAAAATWVLNAAVVGINATLTVLKIGAVLAWAALFGPIGGAILIIAALGTAFVGLYMHWDLFRNLVNLVGKALYLYFIFPIKIMIEVVKILAPLVGRVLGGAFDVVFNKILHLGDLFRGLMNALKGLPGFLGGAAEGIIKLLSKLTDFGVGLATSTSGNAAATHVAAVARRALRGAGGAQTGRGAANTTGPTSGVIPYELAHYLYGVQTTAAQRTAASALTDPAAKVAAKNERAQLASLLSTANRIFAADRKLHDTAGARAQIPQIVALSIQQQLNRGVSQTQANAYGAAIGRGLTAELTKGTAGKVLGETFLKARGLGPVLYARQSRVAPGTADNYGNTAVAFLSGSGSDTSAQMIRALQRALDAAREQLERVKDQLDVARQQLAVEKEANQHLAAIAGHSGTLARSAGRAGPPAARNLRRAGVY